MWLYVICAVLLAACISFLGSPKGRGWIGEWKVKRIIGRTKSGERYIINNLVLKLENGSTSQIDHVLINPHGVFVIETKNYSGRIYGNEYQQEWTQVLNYGRVKNKLYNPLKQNKTHVYHVSKILATSMPIASVVVFVQGNTQFIEASNVYSLSGLKKLIRQGSASLSVAEMEIAYEELTTANQSRNISNREHVKNIHTMQQNLANHICPRCGKNLLLRHGKSGDFLGCSGYPSCRFTKKID